MTSAHLPQSAIDVLTVAVHTHGIGAVLGLLAELAPSVSAPVVPAVSAPAQPVVPVPGPFATTPTRAPWKRLPAPVLVAMKAVSASPVRHRLERYARDAVRAGKDLPTEVRRMISRSEDLTAGDAAVLDRLLSDLGSPDQPAPKARKPGPRRAERVAAQERWAVRHRTKAGKATTMFVTAQDAAGAIRVATERGATKILGVDSPETIATTHAAVAGGAR